MGWVPPGVRVEPPTCVSCARLVGCASGRLLLFYTKQIECGPRPGKGGGGGERTSIGAQREVLGGAAGEIVEVQGTGRDHPLHGPSLWPHHDLHVIARYLQWREIAMERGADTQLSFLSEECQANDQPAYVYYHDWFLLC